MMFGSSSGRGFGGAIDYDLDINGRHDKDARILYAEGVDVFYDAEGQLVANDRQLARSFRAQAMMNPDVKKCVKHLWISFKPEDLLVMVNNAYKGQQYFTSLDDAIGNLGERRVNEITDEAMVEDAKRLLKEMHYDKTQFLIVRHSEKSNPHVHVTLNMVDNEGNRLKDFQEKKRGIAFCRQITLERNYTWGDHKSVSEAISHNPKTNARAEISSVMCKIATPGRSAKELQRLASRWNVGVQYSTDYNTGIITGISFSKDGFTFPATRVDASLSAKKLFPNQLKSNVPLSSLSLENQNTVKAGGVVQGFNNQLLYGVIIPEAPKTVKEARARDEYHKAIQKAEKTGSRTSYIYNIVGMALDSGCGASEVRAEAVAPYVVDEETNKTAEVQRIHEIVQTADEQEREKATLFKRIIDLLRTFLTESLNLKAHSITKEKGRETIRWDDIRDDSPVETVGLARDVQQTIGRAYKHHQEERARKAKETQEAARQQAPSQEQAPTLSPSTKPNPSHKDEPSEKKTTQVKISH